MQLPATRQNFEIDEFQHALVEVCGNFRVCPCENSQSIKGAIHVDHIAGLDIARIGLQADQVLRNQRDIRQDPGDHYFLIFQEEGRAWLSQNDKGRWIEPGEMYIVDSTQISEFRFENSYSLQTSIHLPREEMEHRFGRRIHGGLDISREDPMGHALHSVLVKLLAQDSTSGPHLTSAFYSVLGALLTERKMGEGGNYNPDRMIVHQALDAISLQFRDSDFNSELLARTLGLSTRRLQRAFQIIGETPHDRLQRYRIEVAHMAITQNQARQQKMSITQIAYDHGFRDLSTFYRNYKRLIGQAPLEEQALALPCASDTILSVA